jgi:hypothetical protein
MPIGQGVWTYKNGDKFEVGLKNGYPDGLGVITRNNGKKFRVECLDGVDSEDFGVQKFLKILFFLRSDQQKAKAI